MPRDDQQPKFTRGQNLILAFSTLPAVVAVAAVAVFLRHFWVWEIVAVVVSLGLCAPPLQAALDRRRRRRETAE